MKKFFALALVATLAMTVAAPAMAIENVVLLKGKTTVTVYYKDGRIVKKKTFTSGYYRGQQAWILRVGAPVKKVCIGSLCNTRDGRKGDMIFQ